MIQFKWPYLVAALLLAIGGYYMYQKYKVAPKLSFSGLPLRNLNNEVVSLDAYKGKKVLLCFGASWCGNCRVELKDLLEVYKEQLPDVEILVISDEKLETIRMFKDSKSYPFTFLQLQGTFSNIGIHSIPTSYILNKAQEVKKETVGYLNWTDPSTAKHLYMLMGD